MYEYICRTLLNNGAKLLYTSGRWLENTLKMLSAEFPFFHYEISANEKIAYELALAGGIASKRTGCVLTTEGLYEALDPLMSSAYTGVAKGLLIVCIQETEQEVTPVGIFSKLPVIVSEDADSFSSTVEFGYQISEKYEIPVIIQTTPDNNSKKTRSKKRLQEYKDDAGLRSGVSQFIKNPGRWAATPKFRNQLHKTLNKKIEAIREEFESYKGNFSNIKGKTGIISYKKAYLDFYEEDTSILHLSTIFPLPVRLVNNFIEKMEEVFVIEGEYPAIELQIPNRKKVRAENIYTSSRIKKHDENIFGFEVVRDRLGPASSINIAHGIKKTEPGKRILAITYEDHFLHSGMPAFVNTLYNDSSFILLIMTNEREDDIKAFMKSCGFKDFFNIENINEIEHYRQNNHLTVLLCKGIL